jgi:hypothetical protein
MHRGPLVIKFHGEVRDADLKKIKIRKTDKGIRHIVTCRS